MVIWFYRDLLAALTLSSRFKGFEKYDYLVELGFQVHYLNPLNCLCGSLIPLFVIYVDYVVHFKHYNYIWRLAAQVVNVDAPNFLRHNPQFVPKIQLTKPMESIRSLKQVGRAFWDLPSNWKVHFNVVQLEYYPKLPAYSRVRAIFVHLVANLIDKTTIIIFTIGMG